MQRVSVYFLIKGCIALMALVVGGVLIWNGSPSQEVYHTATFVLPLDTGMDTTDVMTNKWENITRLQASIQCIKDIVSTYPQYAFGIITQGKTTRYLLPPTQDTGTITQYIQSILTDGSALSPKSWTTEIQSALGSTPSIWLGNEPSSDIKFTYTLPWGKLTSCNDQNTHRFLAGQEHLSSWQQKIVLGGMSILVLLLLL